MYIDTQQPSAVPLDLTNPNLRALSHVLRHRELWPSDFAWDFHFGSTCAIGLSRRVLGDFNSERMDAYSENRIFFSTRGKRVRHMGVFSRRARRMSEVTPEMVADQIDEYLEAA